MSKTNNYLFIALHIIAWLIFVGLCIEAGALVVNFVFSLFKPEMLQHLYQTLDLTYISKNSKLIFFGVYGFILTLAFLKVCLFYVVVMFMHRLDLANPFNSFVSRQIYLISYYTLSIGFFSFVAKIIIKNLTHYNVQTHSIEVFLEDSQAFILMGAIIYIIAIIFKKGIDIQNENELTV